MKSRKGSKTKKSSSPLKDKDSLHDEDSRRRDDDANNVDSILSLRGRGKEIWEQEDPDSYLSSLRSRWK